MPGIIVGVDGSSQSRRALQWALSEAAARHAPLTVLSVRDDGVVTCTAGDLTQDQAACARCPVVTAALDAVLEAYHNPAASLVGDLCISPVMSPRTRRSPSDRAASPIPCRCAPVRCCRASEVPAARAARRRPLP